MTPSATLTYDAADEVATQRLGAALAAALPPRATVALNGPLGAGKTRLVQAVARACGVPTADVTSPTFVLINEYRGGERAIYHFDAYRLKDDDEFLELGPEEYFARDGWCFVEWGERVQRCLPRDRLEIEIEPQGDAQRRFMFRGHGEAAARTIHELTTRL